MNPTQKPPVQQPLDPDVVNLTKAIRQVESGNNPAASGASGEYGAYQFEPATWNAMSAKYGVTNVPLQQATLAQQNQVAYGQINDWKKQGYNIGQIASMWNAGAGSPNAYLQNHVGTNSYGVTYNTPQYAQNVANAYQQFKNAGTTQYAAGSPAITPASQTATPNQNTGFLGTNPNDDLYGKILNNSITRGIQDVFPGQKIGQDIGTLGGYIASGFNPNYDLSAPSPLQAIGDVAQGALMVGTGMPEGSATSLFGRELPALAAPASRLGRIVQNAALGAGYGASGAVSGGATDPSSIMSSAGMGAIGGGAAGIGGELLSTVLDALPRRLTTTVFKQLTDPDTIDYATKNVKLGSAESMLANSQAARNSYNDQISSILDHPDYNPTVGMADTIPNTVKVSGRDVASDVLGSFPNSEYTPQQIFDKMRSQVPAQGALITKLQNGSITLQEADTLRKGVDKVTYKSVIDSPEVRAGKEIASKFGNSLRNKVQTFAPETKAIFSNYSKEIRLYESILKLQKAEGKKSIISMRDIIGGLLGHSLAGLPGAAIGSALEKFQESPVAKLAAAKALNAIKPAAKAAVTIGTKTGALAQGALASQTTP